MKNATDPLRVILADYQNPQHGRDLLQLMDEYSRDPFGSGEPLPAICQHQLLPSLSKIPGAFSVLAYRDAQPLGLVNCFMGFSTFACRPLVNIHDLVVSVVTRGAGICTAMLESVAKEAKRRDCCKITLEVLEKNLPAQAAYRKCGFKPYALDEEFGQAHFWQRYL